MITGDNPLTACHVAKELRITRRRQTLTLAAPDNPGQWLHHHTQAGQTHSKGQAGQTHSKGQSPQLP